MHYSSFGFRLVTAVALATVIVHLAACGSEPGNLQSEEPIEIAEDQAEIDPAMEDLVTVLESLSRQLEDVELQMAALEQAFVKPIGAGDDWEAVRDATTPEMRVTVKLYAECRAGEWSRPGGHPVIQGSGLDEAGRAVAAGLEEAAWREMAAGRMSNSQSSVVKLIDRTHSWPHYCAMEGLYSD